LKLLLTRKWYYLAAGFLLSIGSGSELRSFHLFQHPWPEGKISHDVSFGVNYAFGRGFCQKEDFDLVEQALEKEKIPLTGKFHFTAERAGGWDGPFFDLD